MKKILLIFLVASSTCGFTQEVKSISGFVLSADDGQAIPNASIRLKHKNVFTIANDEGYFQFHFTHSAAPDTLSISSIGFKTLNIALNQITDGLKFKLTEEAILLSAVAITAGKELTGKQLVKLAVDNIDRNYANKFLLESYFRKLQKVDGKYVSFLDAAVKIYDDQFTADVKKKRPELVNVIAVRKSRNVSDKGYGSFLDQIYTQSNWLARLLERNDIRYRKDMLHSKNRFEITGNINVNGRFCYIVSVYKKPLHYIAPGSRGYEGRLELVIDADNYKVYKIVDREVTNDLSNASSFPWTKKIDLQKSARVTGGDRVIEFKEYKDSLYVNYISEVIYTQDFDVKTGKTIHLNEYTWELSVSKVFSEFDNLVLTNFNVNARTNLIMSLTPYNADFWKTYNVISFSNANRKAFADIAKEMSMEKQFEESSSQLLNQQK